MRLPWSDQVAIWQDNAPSMHSTPLLSAPSTYDKIELLVLMLTSTWSRCPVTIELHLISGHNHTATSELSRLIRPSPHQNYGKLSYTGYVNGSADSHRLKLCMDLKIGNAPHLNFTCCDHICHRVQSIRPISCCNDRIRKSKPRAHASFHSHRSMASCHAAT